MQGPVAEDWHILLGMAKQTVLENNDSATSWTQVLLGTGEHDVELVPWDWLGSNVGAEIADDWLVFWNQMPWESIKVKSEAVHSLVGAEVEEGGIWVHVPLVVWHLLSAIVIGPVVENDVSCAVLLHLIQILV